MRSEEQVEQALVEKGLTAPRVTPADVTNEIVSEAYYVFPGTTTTICLLTMKNGYTLVGESACASVENFNEEEGQRIACDNARNKIWPLLGYALRNTLNAESQSALI